MRDFRPAAIAASLLLTSFSIWPITNDASAAGGTINSFKWLEFYNDPDGCGYGTYAWAGGYVSLPLTSPTIDVQISAEGVGVIDTITSTLTPQGFFAQPLLIGDPGPQNPGVDGRRIYTLTATYDGDSESIDTTQCQLDNDGTAPEIILHRNEQNYQPNDTVTLYGIYTSYTGPRTISVQIWYPDGTTYRLSDSNGLRYTNFFSYQFQIGANNEPHGVYDVTVRKGGLAVAETSFLYGASLFTDQSSYTLGETVMVRGRVPDPQGGVATVQILYPDSTVYRTFTTTLQSNGFFSQPFTMGNIGEVSGEYTISVSYNAYTTSTIFDYSSSGTAPATMIQVQTDAQSYTTGQAVVAYGRFEGLEAGQNVTIEVRRPNNSVFSTTQTGFMAGSNFFSEFFTPSGATGQWTVYATYNGVTDSTTFDLT